MNLDDPNVFKFWTYNGELIIDETVEEIKDRMNHTLEKEYV